MNKYNTENKPIERPVVFTTDEVRATLEGRKTRHRVLMERYSNRTCLFSGNWRYDGLEFAELCEPDPRGEHYMEEIDADGNYTEHYVPIGRCHLGSIGDRLWVQESYAVAYRADDLDDLNWRGAEHMTREASRLLLEITDVKPSPVRGSNDVIVNWVWVIDFKVLEGV